MRIVVKCALTLLAAAQIGTAASQISPEPTPACHILTRRPTEVINLALIAEPQRANYRSGQMISKRDIVCVGGHLIVDSNLYSNGGNIILIGDRITIRANVDTRIYRQYSLEGNFAGPGAEYDGNLDGYSYVNALDVLNSGGQSFTRSIRSSFVEYYRCIDCRGESNRLLIPRMPDGVTLPMVNMPLAPAGQQLGQRITHGTPAPDIAVDSVSMRSGAIFLFARELIMETGGAIISSGIAGGIGGAGQPPPCVGGKWEGGSFSCLNNGYGQSGESGAGGRGGDAGPINFFFTDAQASERLRRQLASGAPPWLRSSGGIAGSNTKFLSPSDAVVPLTGTINDFRPVGVFPQAANGTDGPVVVETIEPASMIPLFYDLVRGFDSLENYDLVELGQRIRENSSIEAVSFTDFIASRMYREVASRYTAIVSSAERHVRTGRRSPVDSDHFLFSCLIPSSADELMPPQLRVPLNLYRTTCERDFGRVSLHGYMLLNGGVLNINDLSASANVRIDRITLAIGDSSQVWSDILDSLGQINERVLQIYVSVERVRQENELRNLRSAAGALAARLDALRAQNAGNQDFFRLVTAAAALGTGTGAFYSAFTELTNDTHPTGKGNETRPATTSDTLSELSTFGKAGSTLLTAWAGMTPFFTPNATANLRGTERQLAELRQQIRATQAAYSQFMSWAAGTRQQILNDQARYLVNVVYSRNRHANHLRDRLIGFDDLLKLTILSFINDPSLRIPVVQRNLSALAIFVSDYRRERPSLSVRTPVDGCGSEVRLQGAGQQTIASGEAMAPGCAVLRRESRARSLRFSDGEGPPTLNAIPLAIVTSGQGTVQIPLFGINPTVLSVD